MLSHFTKNAAVSTCRAQARRQMGLLAPLLGGNVNQNGLHEEFGGTPSLVPMQLSPPTVKTSTSPNGIRITSEDTKAPLTTITVNLGLGSRDGTLRSSGAALLAKHLQLGSSVNRSKLRIQRELDELGASVTTTLGRENLTIHVAAQAQHFGALIDILGDNFAEDRPLLRHEVNEITQTVLHDITHASDEAVLADAIHAAAYYDSIGLGLPIYSSRAAHGYAVAPLLARTVVASNISVAVTGVDHDQVSQGIADKFANVAEGTHSREASEYVGGETRVERPGNTQIAIALNAGSNNGAAASVLATVLGSATQQTRRSIGGVSTGRASSIVQGNDAMTQVSGFAHTHSDGGIVGISATTASPDESAFAALASALKAGSITDAEVARAKAVLLGAAASDASSQSGRGAAYIAASLGQTTAADIEAVTTADVTSALSSALKSAPSFATIGDITHAPRYNALSRLL